MNEISRNTTNNSTSIDDEPLPRNSISFAKVLHVLVKRRVLVVASIFIFTIIGCIYVVITPAKYTATGSLLIDTRKMPWFQTQTLVENSSLDDGAVESQIETIRSEQVALAVIKNLDLTKDPEFVGSGRSFLNFAWSFLGLSDHDLDTTEMLQRIAVESFKTRLKVSRVAHSYVAEISFTSLDKAKAAKVANSVADAYIEDQLGARFAVARRASVWLQARIQELREQSTVAFKAIQDFKSENNVIIGTDGKLVSELEMEQLANDLAKARAETTEAQAKADRIQNLIQAHKSGSYDGLPDPSIIDAMNNSIIQKLRETLLDDQKQIAELSGKYGIQHVAVTNLRTEVNNTNAEIWSEMDRIAESLKSDLQIAKQREKSLNARLTEVFAESKSSRDSQVKLQDLETASTTYRKIYENFLDTYTQAVQQQSFPATEARLITYATPPMVKSSPKTKLTIALAMFAGLIAGAGAALLREQLDRVVHTRENLFESSRLNTIAIVPLEKSRGRTVDGVWRGMNDMWEQFIGRRHERHSDPRQMPAVLVKSEDSLSAQSEALRAIKVSIDLQRLTREIKIVGVTSPLAREGKSSIAISLAMILVESGKKTLLVDADLRSPSLSKLRGVTGAHGLIEMLADPDTSNPRAFVEHDKRGFDFLSGAAKTRPVNTADLLASDKMHDFLTEIATDYDYVIVDLPPLLPSVDVRASAHRFDAFLMVVEWGRTTMDEVARAMRQSDYFAKKTIGIVLNKVDPVAIRRYEGYGHAGYAYGIRA